MTIQIKDKDGLTAKQWAAQQFEYEYCSECGGDIADHDYFLFPFGSNWFARCKSQKEVG